MSDYRIDADLGAEGAPFRGSADALNDVERRVTKKAKVKKVLDQAENLAARKLGSTKAHELREEADKAIENSQSLFEKGRGYVDDQLVVSPYRTVAAAAFMGLLAGVLLTPRKKKIVYVRDR